MLLYIIMEIVENTKEVENKENYQPFSQEELQDAEVVDQSIDYRKKLNDDYKDYVEPDYTGIDDYIEDCDKVALIRECNFIIEKNYPQYPSIMSEILVKKMYYDTILNMNKEDYLEEKRQLKKLPVIERELEKINNKTNLDYALKD